MNTKRLLELSGGMDSAALALLLKEKQPELEIEYIYIDTGYNLPEATEFMAALEEKIGKITRINTANDGLKKDFVKLLNSTQPTLPSVRKSWCTVSIKQKPYIDMINGLKADGFEVIQYLSYRSDDRNKVPSNTDISFLAPFKEAGIGSNDVRDIIERNGIELPKYLSYRSNPFCFLCYRQTNQEWANLARVHPDLFAQALALEKQALENSKGGDTYFLGSQPLDVLETIEAKQHFIGKEIETISRIRKKIERRTKHSDNPLTGDDIKIDYSIIENEIGDEGNGACLTCYK